MGDEMMEKLGKLMVNECDEDTNISWETFNTLVNQIGGFKYILLYFGINIIRRGQWIKYDFNFGRITESIETDPTGEAFKTWLFWTFFWSITLQINYQGKDYMNRVWKESVG